jgi:hypothetical protein
MEVWKNLFDIANMIYYACRQIEIYSCIQRIQCVREIHLR